MDNDDLLCDYVLCVDRTVRYVINFFNETTLKYINYKLP